MLILDFVFCSKDVSSTAWVISKEGKSSPLFFSKDWGLILLKDGLEKYFE